MHRALWEKIFRIDDTPQKIALGFGLGVTLGIFPGTGALASLFLAWVFRLNRLSALLGSLLVNTWLSVVSFLLALKAGAFLLGLSWQELFRQCQALVKNFSWQELFSLACLRLLWPVILGYLSIGALAGFAAYLFLLGGLILFKRKEGRC
jgi:uncharacterized protein (DUF2062 family)